MMKNKSEKLFEKSKKLIPGGVNSPVRAYKSVGRTPLFIDHAKGSKIYDVDGNEYIDYVCSWGPMILGHANKEVIRDVKRACSAGLSFGAPTKKEYILAQLINRCIPSMENVRLVSSGTEAVMSAIRVARGYTGRDKVVKFRGCYHGHSDGMLVKAGSGALTDSTPDSAGVPVDFAKNTLIAEYNDKESIKRLFDENKGEIACVIVEPVAANMGVVLPKEGFLEYLREITKANNALLIFDEVITGFRISLGGAQEYYGVTPDLTTLGKIVGGGMPLAAYGGSKEIMSIVAPSGDVYQAGTLSGNPIAVTAGITTLKLLIVGKKKGLYEKLDEKGRYIADSVREVLGDKVCVNQIGSLLSVFFTDKSVTDYETALSSDTEKYAGYFNSMLDQGIYLAPSQFEAMFVSAVHSEAEIKKTVNAVKNISYDLDKI